MSLASWWGRLRARHAASPAQRQFREVCALAGRELQGRFALAPPTPLISFVCPLHDTPPAYLDDLLASFRAQIPGFAELILSDDGSTAMPTAAWLKRHAREPGLTILSGAPNRGIAGASNAGIAAARGAWIGFIDHDDALSPHAVAVIARAIEENPLARFLYTDELIADGRLKPLDFFDKPAFDDVLLSGVNYINHLSLYRRDLMDDVGGFREGFDGSQDYDLLLRATRRLKPEQIRHVPYPAYIWRRDGGSYSVRFIEKATAHARRALGEAYGCEVGPAAILPDLHRVHLVAPRPKVSVVVVRRNAPEELAELVEGLFRRTNYPDLELVVLDDGSDDPRTLALYETLRERPGFRLGAAASPPDLSQSGAILRLAPDVRIVAPDWLTEMVACLAFPRVGIVGARLLDPEGALQHAGLVAGLPGPWWAGRPGDFPGPMGRLAVRSRISGVSQSCMLISGVCWRALGPGADICERAKAAGFSVLYTPFATLVRPQPDAPERLHAEGIDPAMSPWHGRDQWEPARISLDRLPHAR